MKKNPRMRHTVNHVGFFHLKTTSTLQPCPFLQCDILPVTLQQRMAKPVPKAAQKHLRRLAADSVRSSTTKLSPSHCRAGKGTPDTGQISTGLQEQVHLLNIIQ